MRSLLLVVASALGACAFGCAGRDVNDPSDFSMMTEDGEPARVHDRSTRRGDPDRTIHVRCDEDGNLHVHAPEGVRVNVPESANADAEAEIDLGEGPGHPIRQTKSLGFIGDGKLGESRSHGGPWNAPDGLLPKHAHGYPSGGTWGNYAQPVPYRSYFSYGGGYGFGGFGGGASRGSSASSAGAVSHSRPPGFGISAPPGARSGIAGGTAGGGSSGSRGGGFRGYR